MYSRLKDIVSGYHYGKHGLLSREVNIFFDPKRETVSITNFMSYGPGIRVGDCVELAHSLEMRLRKERKTYSVVVSGNDPDYYRTNKDKITPHRFLLVSDKKALARARDKDLSDASFLKKVNPYVVDPSFRVVIPYQESGYTLGRVIMKLRKETTIDMEVHGEDMAVLGISDRNNVIGLIVDARKNDKSLLQISDWNPDTQSSEYHDIQNTELEDILSDDQDLLDIIRFLEERMPRKTKKAA